MNPKNLILKNLIKKLLDISLSSGQLDIVNSIYYKKEKRVQVICCTQYGKSFAVAIAVLLCMTVKNEKFLIVAPTEKKASIIMSYIIDLMGKSPIFYLQLDYEKGDTYERLKRERSKKKITFSNGGAVEILSLDARNSKRNIEAAMGKGSKNVILDESSLVPDLVYATVKRMLGGYGNEGFLLEIGNPFYRNHFFRTWHSEQYKKIFIDYKQALNEGRFTKDFIDEMRKEALFDVFYECKFPEEDLVDEKGYRQLLTTKELETCFTNEFVFEGDLKLGVDVGAGGDKTVFCLRSEKTATILLSHKSADTMTNVQLVLEYQEKYGIKDYNIFIDDIGVGRGLTDRLRELGKKINAVSWGERAVAKNYSNLKAEAFFNLANWIKNGGKLVENLNWHELSLIKYKVTSDKYISIESKEEFKKKWGKSPDFADALALSFVPVKKINISFV